MTISLVPQDSRQRRFEMTGGETVLPVTFPFFAAADLLLLRQRDGITAALVLGTDYTVSGAGNPSGGAATLTVPALAGDLVVVISAQPDARTSGWTDGQALTAAALNAEFARKWIGMQQMRRDLDRSVRLPATDPPGGLELPGATDRAGRFLGFDGSGDAVAMGAPDAPLGAVARSGDTMTGDLGISKTNPKLRLNSATPTTRGIEWRTNNVNRWELMAWNDAESGANAGSTLFLRRFDDTGALLGNIFNVDRATGRMTFTGAVLPRVPAIDPTDANDLARKAYVDTMAPPGALAAFARNTAPAGWLKANGAAVSRTTYAALFAAAGTTFGAGDGSTTFNLPDLRGEFIRGWDDGRGVDSGRAFGSTQTDAMQGHRHLVREQDNQQVIGSSLNAAGGGPGTVAANTDHAGINRGNVEARDLISNGANGTPRTADETRPRNVAPLVCVKF